MLSSFNPDAQLIGLRIDGKEDGFQNGSDCCPDVGQDLADVVAAAAKNCKYGISERAFERAAGQAAVRFHVPYLGLDCSAAF